MRDLTALMYEAAERIYEEIGERHGYTGLCAGLSAVCRELGMGVDRGYFSRRHHDPLSGFHSDFALQRLTFPDLIRMWDQIWFGLGTGKFRELPYPWSELHRLHSPHLGSIDLKWVEDRIARHIKETKVRRGTRAYKDFVRANARQVLDEATRISKIKHATMAEECRKQRAETEDKAAQAAAESANLGGENNLRRALLEAAGLPGSPITDREMILRSEAWQAAERQLATHASHLKQLEAQATSADAVEDAALEALERSKELAPFPAALNMVSKWKANHGAAR